MAKKSVGIIGLGKYLPEKVLTNFDLEKMVETSDEWITTRTGIRERHIANESQSTSDLASLAAKEALKDANLKPEEIELIIVATITPDMPFPSTSCLVQEKIGAKKATCFDIAAACSGFIYGLNIAHQFISSGTYKNALVIGAEILSKSVDWTDRSTCVLFGDGAGACVLAPVKKDGIISFNLGSDGSGQDLLKIPAGGTHLPASHESIDKKLHFIQMQGNEVFKFAVKIMHRAAEQAVRKKGLGCSDIDLVIPHQANRRIMEAAMKKMGLPLTKLFSNIEKYGNMSAASTAVALCEAVEEKRVKRKDIVVLVAFGAGLTWGSCVIKW
jgi:3-oxoacyl-[acyl-carrier-protein] synthase-3